MTSDRCALYDSNQGPVHSIYGLRREVRKFDKAALDMVLAKDTYRVQHLETAMYRLDQICTQTGYPCPKGFLWRVVYDSKGAHNFKFRIELEGITITMLPNMVYFVTPYRRGYFQSLYTQNWPKFFELLKQGNSFASLEDKKEFNIKRTKFSAI